MQILKKLIVAVAILLSAFPDATAADAVDSEGYPLMYVRGAFGGWGVDNAYLFSRNGNSYSITLPSLDGEFKISGSDWKCNFGSETGSILDISGTAVVNGTHDGRNFNARSLTNLSITFALDIDNLEAPTPITITVGGGTAAFTASGTLPIMYINVYTDETHTALNNEIISKDLAHKDYFEFAEYWLDTNGCAWLEELGAESIGSADAPLPLQIKARGNWTRRGFSKKPFKIKLGQKQKLLGMTNSKHFALLAHADDSWGYMRNFVGFDLGKRIGLPWTPAQQPVEVFINGDYRGLYFLTESIRVEKDRVNITELDDLATDPTLISGGYLVEMDNYEDENQIAMEERSFVGGHTIVTLRITFNTPEKYSDVQRRFIREQFTAMNNAVGSNSDEMWAYMDLDDAARYYIVEEIISHTESYHGSTYLFRDRGEGQKWHFSPLWDCGNAFSGPVDGFFYDHDPYGNTWIPSMRANTAFNQKVRDTWLWFMTNAYDGIERDIADYASHIAAAAVADRRRWANQPVPDGGQSVADNTDMEAKRDVVIDRLRNKTKWMCRHFGDYTTAGTVAEPARDTTPAAPLPGYASSGVEDITVSPEPVAAPVEYFTPDGLRVDTPRPGRLYIRRHGTATAKIIF